MGTLRWRLWINLAWNIHRDGWKSRNIFIRLQILELTRTCKVQAEIDVINESWNVGGTSNGLADSVGLMVYEGTQVSWELFLGAGVSHCFFACCRPCSMWKTMQRVRPNGRVFQSRHQQNHHLYHPTYSSFQIWVCRAELDIQLISNIKPFKAGFSKLYFNDR